MNKADLKNEMENLIERWFALDRGDIDYEELVQCEKERVESRMGGLVCGNDLVGTGDIDTELEDMIPSPICWR